MSVEGRMSTEDRIALEDLVTELIWRIDHGAADTAYELFTKDGTMALGPQVMNGHDELKAWAAGRAGLQRTTRHACSNFRFVSTGPATAEGTIIGTVYMRDGDGPAPAVAAVVCEYRDEYVREEGRWLVASRNTDVIFAGGAS